MPRALSFAPFTLDVENACLMREGVKLALSPKDFALLHYLARHRGRIVSNAELLSAVWKGDAVGPEVVKVRVGRVRRLLGDDVGSPRFIANVHGEGYRFVALTAEAESAAEMPLVGREVELARLEGLLAEASAGNRRIVFVTGEPGIGKTRLIDELSQRAGRAAPAWVARGQCIEHYGGDESYLPVLEALGRLARNHDRESVRAALAQQAPSWLLELPGLSSEAERAALRRHAIQPTPARMTRELADAFEALTAAAGAPVLILVLEDLQWADPSTLGFLATMAQRRDRARVLIVASYRPLELASPDHPLRRLRYDLGRSDATVELELPPLTREHVGLYLEERFRAHDLPSELAASLHRRTDGNPLFLTEVVRDLVAGEVMTIRDERWILNGDPASIDTMIPSSIRQLAARLRERLTTEEQRLLEAASLEGLEFSATSIAAALEREVAEIEETCLRLAEGRQFIRFAGNEEWPDGARSTRFAFLHGVHRDLWSERVAAHRRQQWHRLIGERRQAAYGERADEIAAELALHFEEGRDEARSIAYRETASRQAIQRAAHAEARAHLLRALALAAKLRDPQERLRAELSVQVGLGSLAAMTEGYGAEVTARAYRRAREISGQIGASPDLFHPLFGLARYYWSKGDLEPANELAAQLLRLVQREEPSARLVAAHAACGSIAYSRGELSRARSHLETGLRLCEVHWRPSLLPVFGNDLEVICLGTLATTLQLLGYPDQAARYYRDLCALGGEGAHPFLRGAIAWGAGMIHQIRGDWGEVAACGDELVQLGTRYEMGHLFAFGAVFHGWVAIASGRADEGVEQIDRAVRMVDAAEARLCETYIRGLLAQGLAAQGRIAEARAEVATALAACDRQGERWYEAALLRIDGELLLAESTRAGADAARLEREAEDRWRRSIEVARHQAARSQELRTALALGGLWRQRGDEARARKLVDEVYRRFDEGFESPDLLEAQAFLDSAGTRSAPL